MGKLMDLWVNKALWPKRNKGHYFPEKIARCLNIICCQPVTGNLMTWKPNKLVLFR
jgi:hypothetical protein